MSGVQMTVFPKILDQLKKQGADDMIVVAGGVMPDDDVAALKQMGVKEVMLQDTPPQSIIDYGALVGALIPSLDEPQWRGLDHRKPGGGLLLGLSGGAIGGGRS